MHAGPTQQIICSNKFSVVQRTVQSALLKARLDSLAACFLCLVPIPRQQTEHAGGHTHAVLRSVAEAFVKCVILTHPDRQ
jgi:hypothetical protein